MFAYLCAGVFLLSVPDPLQNCDFSAGDAHWIFSAPAVAHAPSQAAGGNALCLEVSAQDEVSYYHYRQDFATAPGDILELSVTALGENVHDGNGVYASISFFDVNNQRISFCQSMPVDPDGNWHEITVRCLTPPDTAYAHCALLLHGRGRGCFDEVRLAVTGRQEDAPPAGPVTLRVASTPICESLIGFGAEDDGWFFNQDNAPDALAMDTYNTRLEWMDPDWTRMFFWYQDFNPAGDWKTYDWETDNMQSHYKALEVYQRIGAAVNVTGVEWNMKSPFADPRGLATTVGALLEHLIKDKGFTCVKYWTLTNEPNTHFLKQGATFDDYVEMHRLVKEEIAARGLDVKIIGSDDTNGGLAWFKRCVETPAYMEAVDLFASHRYLKTHEIPLAEYFFSDRLGLLNGVKPFTVAEFGFQDERSGTLENPIMETYPYAVWTAAFAIDGLNQGVAGFTIWCLHEVLYPNQWRMTYGLWNYADRGWNVRPVYHAWALFTRHTESGMKVYPIASSHPGAVRATKAGDVIFIVNQSENDVEVTLEGAAVNTIRLYTEDTLYGDRECGYELNITGGKIILPAMSFGVGE